MLFCVPVVVNPPAVSVLPATIAAAVDGRFLAEYDGTGGSNEHLLYGKDNSIGAGNLTIIK